MLDVAVQIEWETLAPTGVSQKSFYRTHRSVLNMFAEEDDWVKIASTDNPVRDSPAEVARVVSQCQCGKAMFWSERLEIARGGFIVKVERAVKDVEHLDFSLEAIESFKSAMTAHAATLADCGVKPFENHETRLRYLTADIVDQVDSVNEEHALRLGASIKQAAFSSGLVPRYPWVKLLWGDNQPIPNVVTCARMDQELLHPYEAVMEQLNTILGPGPHTIKEMKEGLSNKK